MGIQQIIEEWFNDLGIDISLRDSQRLADAITKALPPAPLTLHCPACHTLHVDAGEWATRPHKTHQCQNCQHEWRPYDYPTVGVAPSALPAEAAFDVIVIAGQAYSERLADHAYVRGESVAASAPQACTYPNCTCIGGGVFKSCVKASATQAPAAESVDWMAFRKILRDYADEKNMDVGSGDVIRFVESLIDAAVAQVAPAVREAPGYGHPLPLKRETDKREVVQICDADGQTIFELNTHTQRSLDDKAGLAEERKAAEEFADFVVQSVNRAAPALQDDSSILALSLDVMTRALDTLVGACMDENGKPKAPERRELMQARGYLPAKCRHAFVRTTSTPADDSQPAVGGAE
jgi:hypothetical protein